MKENKYDNDAFFEQYSKMARSQKGLDGAGEWHVLRELLPGLEGKDLLDLGCGYGWHCRYAIEKGAKSATGVDISEKMLTRAEEINMLPGINYLRSPLEEIEFQDEQFDVVLSSLTFHYMDFVEGLFRRINTWLRPSGNFIFSVEHPVFTAEGSQQWYTDKDGEKICWPVDRYFAEGRRQALFLGEKVTKYHRTLTTYINALLESGFDLKEIKEPMPDSRSLGEIPEMKDELRRPMMLLIAAQKRV